MEISFLIICIFDLALILHCSVLPICLGELGNNIRNTQSVGLPAETYSNYYLLYFLLLPGQSYINTSMRVCNVTITFSSEHAIV